MGEGVDIGTCRRRVVSFAPSSLYRRQRSQLCPINMRLGGYRSWIEKYEEIEILNATGTRIPTHKSTSTCSLSLYRLRYRGSGSYAVKPRCIVPRCIVLPDPSFGFCAPRFYSFHFGPATIVFPCPSFFLRSPNGNDESKWINYVR
jgi:hypothetical protein